MTHKISLSKCSPLEKIKTQKHRDAKTQRFSNVFPCALASLRPGVKFSSLRLTSYFLLPLLLLLFLTLPTPTYAQEPDSPPSVSQGGMQWAQNCQPCHGTTGQGDGPSAAGEIDESVYQQARARTKAELARMMESAPLGNSKKIIDQS